MMPHPNVSMGMNVPPMQMQQQQMGPPLGHGSGGPPMPMGSGFNYSSVERSQRSVFVGNIPYEATEEELKELFSQVGPVVGFRLVLDRETGKSKGYGFCEYLDPETASSALRNLNGYEFHGRSLRIDTAAGDRSKEELRQLQMTFGGPQEESPYGPPVEPAKAPEAIGRAVASLPPEQMFELMKQMKLCVQTNPNEARNMLLQNPQLAYALLQAQVVMRIVDPQVAMTMLHRETESVAPIMPPGMAPPPMGGITAAGVSGAGMMAPPSTMMGMMRPPGGAAGGPPMTAGDMDYRSGFPMGPNFMGLPPGGFMAPGPQGPPMQQQQPQQPRAPFGPTASILDRTPLVPQALVASRPPTSAAAAGGEDQEKAALIMQVLQLTDEQIAMLPPDQKQSVLILREQLRSSKR